MDTSQVSTPDRPTSRDHANPGRRPTPKGCSNTSESAAILAHALDHSTHGALWVAQELSLKGTSCAHELLERLQFTTKPSDDVEQLLVVSDSLGTASTQPP